MSTLPSYHLEQRCPAVRYGKPYTVDLISRGETRDSGLAAFDYFVRTDAFGGGRRYAPDGDLRLILTQSGPEWVETPSPENLADAVRTQCVAPGALNLDDLMPNVVDERDFTQHVAAALAVAR